MRYFKLNCTSLMLSLVLAVVFASHTAFAAEFYLFKDKRGHTQIQDSIPSEYIKNGYKIVNERGMTIRVVPSEREKRRKLRASQLRESESSLAAKRRAEEDELDERLFHSFSSAEEIRQAANKKIMSVQTQIDASAKHVQAFENNLQKLEAQRAAGGKANEESIAKLRESIQHNYVFIDRKQQEQAKIRDEYLELIQRYEMLSVKGISNN